jgi:hypothetical protein
MRTEPDQMGKIVPQAESVSAGPKMSIFEQIRNHNGRDITTLFIEDPATNVVVWRDHGSISILRKDRPKKAAAGQPIPRKVLRISFERAQATAPYGTDKKLLDETVAYLKANDKTGWLAGVLEEVEIEPDAVPRGREDVRGVLTRTGHIG